MSFVEPTFLAFFAAVVAIYWALCGRVAQNVFLLVASYVFYGWASPRMALLLLGVTAVNYVAARAIVRFPDRPAAPVPDQPAVAAEADTPELAARRAQLDLLGLGDPGEGTVGPERPAVLPYRSRGAAVTPVELAMRTGTGFWEASAREVAGAGAAQVGVQNCGECGLSLSATARFCRRCGTRQARSA